MKKELTTRVGSDGVLTLSLGREEANKVVRVVVETVEAPAGPASSPEAWRRFIQQTAGSIADPTFVRHPQGTSEERDPLP